MLNIALPKGRLGDAAYRSFADIGYACDGIEEENRKLIFEDTDLGVRYILVKPADVAAYVEHGAADIGIVGKDIIMETEPDVFELFDMNIGRCFVAVSAKNDWRSDINRPLRVATKYPNIARRYYAEKNMQIEVIKLNGSIELAPIVGLSDVIVDIVETGKTLEENDMRVYEKISDSSAWLIANKSSYRFKKERIDAIVRALGGEI